MKRLLSLVAFFATLQASAQQVNPVPDYVFRNQMSVGRGTVTDTAAYFSIGPRYGANKGFMPPIVGDTATFSSGKRNGLLIFSVQKNKFLYWDSVRVQWSDMAGSSGTYITGTGITGYVPQFSGTTTIDTSALFTLGNRLGIGSSTFAYTSTNTANVELNGTAGGILGFKRNDSARGYLWHTGDNMELANTTAGAISFNTNSATRGSISSAGVWRLHNLAGTGDRVVVASSNGTLSASTSVTGLVDTTTISTRAWRQKGDDSLGAIIATKGSGTVTSVATGFGLSGGTITTTGTLLVDTLNISTRAWRQKGLDSLAALEVSGSGTTNYIPKFTAASTIGNSQIFDNGTNVGIGTTTPFTYAGGFTTVAINNATSGGVLDFYSNNLQRGQLYNTNDLFNVGTISSIPLTFSTNTTERARIFANGRIGVNTTTDNGYQLDINGTLRSVNGANFATTSGNVGIGTASPAVLTHISSGYIAPTGGFDANVRLAITNSGSNDRFAGVSINSGSIGGSFINFGDTDDENVGQLAYFHSDNHMRFTVNAAERGRINSAGEWIIDASGTDAGDYKLQVVGNARIGTGKLDISSNTTFSMNVQRSGTSEVAGTFNNSNGILYLGAESSAGGAIFTGSSAYAAVIGSGAAYPLQFATNNVTRATINTNGELLINTLTDNGDFKLQVNGNALISGSIKTANGASSTAQPWHLGSVVATNVQLDTANYVEVEINGVFYRLAIVTPL